MKSSPLQQGVVADILVLGQALYHGAILPPKMFLSNVPTFRLINLNRLFENFYSRFVHIVAKLYK